MGNEQKKLEVLVYGSVEFSKVNEKFLKIFFQPRHMRVINLGLLRPVGVPRKGTSF